MDKTSHNHDGSGNPVSSIRSVFSNLFNRDRSDLGSAVLTSFKELPDGEADASPVTRSESPPQPENEHPGAASGESGRRAESGGGGETDLVLVTRVETYSDSENEDDSCLAKSSAPAQPDEGTGEVGCGDGDAAKSAEEAEMPVFRSHKTKERSLVETILYSERFKRRTGTDALLSPSKRVDDPCADAETLGHGADDGEDFTAIDCSLPVPSVASGLLVRQDEATVEELGHGEVTSPSPALPDLPDQPVRSEKDPSEEASSSPALPEVLDQSAHPQDKSSEELSSSPALPEVSDQSARSKDKSSEEPSSSPASPEIPNQLAPTQEKHSVTPISLDETAASAPDLPPDDLQETAVPSPPQTDPPKTPPSSVGSTKPSSSSTPSQGASFSSPASFQLPALFSGLRVLKKGATGEDRDTTSEIKQREKDADLALLSLKRSVNKAKLFPEQKATSPVKKQGEAKPAGGGRSSGTAHLSLPLNTEGQDFAPEQRGDAESESQPEEKVVEEKTSAPETPASTPERKKTSDLAYETFKNIFGAKSVKKEKLEDVDLEAVKKKIKSDKENLRSIFERVSRSPSKEAKSPTESVVGGHLFFTLSVIFIFTLAKKCV